MFSPAAGRVRAGRVRRRPTSPPIDPELDQLTQREREVLRLIARGYAYKEIAKELFISVKTVETHVSTVLRKLQLSNRHELTRWATAGVWSEPLSVWSDPSGAICPICDLRATLRSMGRDVPALVFSREDRPGTGTRSAAASTSSRGCCASRSSTSSGR